MPVPVDVPREVDRVIPEVRRDSPSSVVSDEGGTDVNLVAVAAGSFSAMDVEDTVFTILGTLQRLERCGFRDIPLPPDRPAKEEGLQCLLSWGNFQ